MKRRQSLPNTCKHPPSRCYAWIVPEIHNEPHGPRVLCVGCCDCGATWERPHRRSLIAPGPAHEKRASE